MWTGLEEAASVPCDYFDPQRHSEFEELELQIEKAIARLPKQCRLVFQLSRFEELKYAEIAEHLNISIKTVENHMGKALKIMRGQLKDYLPLFLIFMKDWMV